MHRTLILIAPTNQESAIVRGAVEDLAAGLSVEVEACGMGPAAATALCRNLDARVHTLRGLALVGWAGGLSPALAAGDVVVADKAVDPRGERSPCTAIPLTGATIGPMLTVPGPILSPEAKRGLWDGRLLAVEMEAYPLAVWARDHSLPFVHARVILDPVDEALPDLGDALDPFGRPRWGRLALRLARRPSLAPGLLQLARRARALSPVLSEVARLVAQSL